MLTHHDKENIEDIIAGKHGDWFTAHLLRLIKKADHVNRDKLRRIWPDEVEAVERWENGLEQVR
jgi:hypothetical protein